MGLVEEARAAAAEAIEAWRTVMASRNDYLAGWIDTSIHDFLEEIGEPPANMKYALITTFDSSPDVASIFEKSKHLTALKGKYRAIGSGVLLATRQLLAAQRRGRIFFGFDEVWFFPNSNVASKPEGLVITAPDLIDTNQICHFSEWLNSNKCSLGLGDGIGMNYWLRIGGAARYIVRAIREGAPHPLDGEWESA